MPSKLILTIGLPGSGKSTWAQEQAATGLVDLVTERDIIREQLTGDRRNHTQALRVTREHFSGQVGASGGAHGCRVRHEPQEALHPRMAEAR